MNIEIATKEYEKELNWDDAMMYCQLLIIDGKYDWRLPTKEELNDIYKTKHGFAGSYYWSSTEHNDTNAWLHGFSYGGQLHFKNFSFYVRPVRSLTI